MFIIVQHKWAKLRIKVQKIRDIITLQKMGMINEVKKNRF